MFQGIFKSAITDANKNYIFGTGSIPIQIKTAQLATFADGTTKQQGYQVSEVSKLISTMLTGWDANGNKPKSMSDNYLELILSCDNGFVVKKRLQFPHIIAWQNDSTPYNIADVYKEFSLDNWLKADDFENPDITLVVEPTDEILTTSTATPPEATTEQSGRFYIYYRNLPVGVNRVHIDFHIKTKTEPIDFDLEVIDGMSWKDAQAIIASNEQAKINVLLGNVKDIYKYTGAEGNFDEITMHEWSSLYQQIISLKPSNKFTHDLYITDFSELNEPILKNIGYSITPGRVINQDGTLSNISHAWGVSEFIPVKANESYTIFATQFPQSPLVGIQLYNDSKQVIANYIKDINLNDNENKNIIIANDGYLRIGVRISTDYNNSISITKTAREVLELVAQDKPKFINKNINFVGMSIWWYDGRELDAGHVGREIAKGYQTLLKQQFDFLSDTGNIYCYSGASLGAISINDKNCIMNNSSSWSASDNAIWTLDTITNDFKRNIPIGSLSDYTEKTGILTYYGALREFADKVLELSGDNAIIVCSNSLRRNNGNYTSTSQNTQGHTLIDYEYALIDVASRNHWYFIDQFRLCGITDDTIRLTTIDGLHLNNFGYTLAVKPWIEQLEIIRKSLME